MEDIFLLRITLGGAEMQTGDDVASALEATAARLRERVGGSLLGLGVKFSESYGTVKDLNGNNVGAWEIQ